MGWKKVLVISTILLCSCKNYYVNHNGGYRPKKSKFKLAETPYKLKKKDLVNTSYVYINKSENRVSYLRFFSDGRFFEGRNELNNEKLKLTTINNFNKYGEIGYFKLNDNKIEIETFNVNLGGSRGNVGYYSKSYGYIKKDSVFIFFNSIENSFEKTGFPKPNKENCIIYIGEKIEGLKQTTDW
ncbi:hypothetical protein [Tenacibaculum ovolyticum]|uniref:hypothetical protein n=1 Tax=Tenacibaculum ovolyticum TaxID=104270 RepID=UPI00048EC0FC|nr:hypothetical protein [Tenacibaculum ovolyticum]